MLAKELPITRGENISRRRRRPKHISKAIHLPAFKVNASKERRRNAFLAFAQQSERLLSPSDIACEENHARGLNFREQGSEPRRHLGAVEADD